MEFFGKLKHKVAAFTLVELMITVAIIAILATVAIGRLDQLKVMAHRAEAKNALGLIGKLQEVYRIEKDEYYAPTTGTLSSSANVYGGTLGVSSPTTCGGNALGFKLKGCAEKNVRYSYYFENHTVNGWIAVATSNADRLGLSCATTPAATTVPSGALTHSEYTNATGTAVAASVNNTTDDTHYVTDRRSSLVHSNDILIDCD